MAILEAQQTLNGVGPNIQQTLNGVGPNIQQDLVDPEQTVPRDADEPKRDVLTRHQLDLLGKCRIIRVR